MLSMMWIDTHCHLTFPELDCQLEAVLARSRAADVAQLITIGTTVVDSQRAIDLADHYPGVFAAIGIHPHHAAQVTASDWAALAELLHHPRVVALGEMGLDYHYDFSDRPSQRAVFIRQLDFARRAALPVIIHCREAFTDLVTILREQQYENQRVVFHCFGGSADEARTILEAGWWISLTGVLTFKKSAALREVIRDFPLERIMLETDAPYLTPEPKRKITPNEPSLLIHTATVLAQLKQCSLADLAGQTTRQACRFFNLPA
ncbi:MAG: D-aminoacyl-tRNA deacylase [Phycisphaerae bacterium]|nr:D-aminoacyl-tRNA deacylase [Phycisphaerae bacterium]